MSTTAGRINKLVPVSTTVLRGAVTVRAATGAERLSPELFAAHDPRGVRMEALRELRTQLLLRWFHEHRMLAVIGPREHDGADVVAANLAIAMAQHGGQTLLVDADLRRRSVDRLFGLAPRAGLADVLQDCGLCDAALQPVTAIPNLHVLSAGTAPDNPQELISRTAFTYLTKTLPDRFEAVIIVTPPSLQYSDAQIIAARTGGCVLVTRRHRTRLADVARTKALLEPARATLVGGIIRE
jgi:capsular exopolysaccharide synthesis family protein